jgi:hypothetical protein
MDIDAAGETQEYQRQQEGNAHLIDPSVAEKQHVSESVPFHGRYVPLLWQVPGETITTGWESLMADHGSLTQSTTPQGTDRRYERCSTWPKRWRCCGRAHGAVRHPSRLRPGSTPRAS